MNIVHLTWVLGVGGAEEMLVDIVNEQCRTQKVSIIVVNSPVDHRVGAQLDPSVKLFCLNRRPGSRRAGSFLQLNWILARSRPDIVHAHSWSLVKPLLYRPYKTLLTVHTTRDVEDFDKSIRSYDDIFAISRAVADEIHTRAKVPRPAVVLNGIPCGDIRYPTKTGPGPFRAVQVARLDHAAKGQDILIRAIARICSGGDRDDIRLDLIGEGPSRRYLEQLVRELGLNDIVTFRGVLPRATVHAELGDYDLLVQPSRFEGFGLAVAEGMAAGVPVLVSDIEGPREIIQSGRFGFLFRPEDDFDCARQIERVRHLKRTGALSEKVVDAHRHALKEFDVARTSREYLDKYRAALETREQGPVARLIRFWCPELR